MKKTSIPPAHIYRRFSTAAGLALLGFLLFSSCVSSSYSGGGADPQQGKTHSFQGIRRLVIDGQNSHIALRGRNQNHVEIPSRTQTVRQEGDALFLTLRGENRFTIIVPQEVTIEAENTNGSFLAAGIQGRIDADLSNTAAVIINPGRELALKTTNKPVNILKRNGSIRRLSADTTNAAVHAALPAEDMNISLETSNSYFRVNNLPVTLVKRSADAFTGYIGSREAGKLQLKTTNRPITLEPAGSASPAAVISAAAGDYSRWVRRYTTELLDSIGNDFVRGALRGVLAEAVSGHSPHLSTEPSSPVSGEGGEYPARLSEAPLVQPRRTAVFPFEETNSAAGELGLGPALSEMLITAVANSPAVTVVERSRMEALLQEAEIQQAAYTSREKSIEVGKMANSEILIVGSVARIGSQVELDTRVIRAETGEVLFTQYGSSAEDKLRPMVNTLGKEICRSITALDDAPSDAPSGDSSNDTP